MKRSNRNGLRLLHSAIAAFAMTTHHPDLISVISYQGSAVPVISYQLSVISYQGSAVSVTSYQFEEESSNSEFSIAEGRNKEFSFPTSDF